MQAHLRLLSNTEVDRLLGYLAKWAHKYTHCLSEAEVTGAVAVPRDLVFPTLSQVRGLPACGPVRHPVQPSIWVPACGCDC